MIRKVPPPPPESARARVVERPDGFYWQSADRREENGPFQTLPEAVEAMNSGGESALEPGESLEEAEDEIGIAGWIDPDTGQPAEESVPRIDDN